MTSLVAATVIVVFLNVGPIVFTLQAGRHGVHLTDLLAVGLAIVGLALLRR